jgi:dTDP-4-dehydrorhamnose reductase
VKDQIGGRTSAVDIEQALMTMARGFETGQVRHKIYHFCGAPACSWAEFARDIFAQSGGRAVLTPVRSKDYLTAVPRP